MDLFDLNIGSIFRFVNDKNDTIRVKVTNRLHVKFIAEEKYYFGDFFEYDDLDVILLTNVVLTQSQLEYISWVKNNVTPKSILFM